MKKLLLLLICYIVYPIGIAGAFVTSLLRWFRNFSIAEVYAEHDSWKGIVTKFKKKLDK